MPDDTKPDRRTLRKRRREIAATIDAAAAKPRRRPAPIEEPEPDALTSAIEEAAHLDEIERHVARELAEGAEPDPDQEPDESYESFSDRIDEWRHRNPIEAKRRRDESEIAQATAKALAAGGGRWDWSRW